MEKILEWKGAKRADEKLAQKVAKQVGSLYFSYNVPLQIFIKYNENGKPESGIDICQSEILNYMPRKDRCEFITLDKVFVNAKKVTAKDVKDFMKVSALVLGNLAKQFKTLDPTKDPDPCIYYPNCSRKPNNF